MRHLFSIAAAALLAIAPFAVPARAAAAQTPLSGGLWINPHGSVAVRTGACGTRLCGWVVWADAESLADARDAGVAHLVGTELLENYTASGAHAWSGTVYLPDKDRRFYSEIEQRSPDQLKIKGCILGGLICRAQVWTRIARLPHG
jgi:uncharacterized protein (DUF2147 family)